MYDLIIVGAGPAGLTAGLYAGRFRMNTLIFEKTSPGGQIILTCTIENYPGFPGGISTYELVNRMMQQLKELGIAIENQEVFEIKPELTSSGLTYNIKTQNQIYNSRAIIIASGAQSKRLGVKGEERLIGRGVSYCGTCDGPLFKDKEIAVIGGGDRAIEEAIFLTDYATKVNLIHRRKDLRASKILEEKARQNPKINFILETVVEEILGNDKIEQVLIKNIKTDSKSLLSCQGIFIFVGIKPNTVFLNKLVNVDEQGFIICDQQMRTSQDGIFACGDCCRRSLYQVITACGEGAVAADSAYKYLLNR